MAKQLAKKIERDATLINEILDLTDKTNILADQLKESKNLLQEKTQALATESREIFDKDMGEVGDDKTPQVFGNHEYISGNRMIDVNFKMKSGGFSVQQIGQQRACEVLSKVLGDKEYKKLFKETRVLEDAYDQDKLKEAREYRPDLVGIRLVGNLPEAEIEALSKKYPQEFAYYIKDESVYASQVKTARFRVDISPAASFIGKVAKLPEDVLKGPVKNFFRKIFKDNVTTAVKCGNRVS